MLLRFRTPLVTAGLVVITSLLATDFAHAAHVVTSIVRLPLSGSFFDPESQETVDIVGEVHVATHVAFAADATSLDISASLPATVNSVGETTGCQYILYGANQMDQSLPPGPLLSSTVLLEFSIPPNPINPGSCGSSPGAVLFARLQLLFAPNGTLLAEDGGGSTVELCGESPCVTD